MAKVEKALSKACRLPQKKEPLQRTFLRIPVLVVGRLYLCCFYYRGAGVLSSLPRSRNCQTPPAARNTYVRLLPNPVSAGLTTAWSQYLAKPELHCVGRKDCFVLSPCLSRVVAQGLKDVLVKHVLSMPIARWHAGSVASRHVASRSQGARLRGSGHTSAAALTHRRQLRECRSSWQPEGALPSV